ncbi:MAG: hypothetical protein DIU54_010665 [Acidobacteriota bacterium]|jgi:hypothetical protein|nr:MAG: hypothetical protein DIU54_01780 [Acidobacteriota bacterium]
MWNEVQQALHDSTTQVLTGLARLLPGLLALLVAVLLSVLIASIVGTLVRRALLGVRFDEKLAAWGTLDLPAWSQTRSPTLLVSRFVSWTIIVIGALIGIAAFDTTLTSSLVLHVFGSLPNILTALLLLVIGHFLARFLSRGVLINAVNMNLPWAGLLSMGVRWLVLVLTTAMALDHVGIGGNIVSLAFGILFGGIVLALALAVGLGSKDMVARSLEKEMKRAPEEPHEQPFRHI